MKPPSVIHGMPVTVIQKFWMDRQFWFVLAPTWVDDIRMWQFDPETGRITEV